MIKPSETYNGLNITFQTNTDCVLSCIYCYEVNKKPEYLKLEDAKKFIDILLDDPNPVGADEDDTIYNIMKEGIILDFIGGDSLMHPELCDQIIQYFVFQANLKKHIWADTWRASISSNGTLFGSKAVRDFMLKYAKNLHVGVSLDGCPEIHNLNRDNSMDKILENWDWYVNVYCQESGTCPGTKATLNKASIPYIYESVKYLHEVMGLTQINMNFIFEQMNLTPEDYAQIEEQLEKAYKYVLEHKDDLYWSLLGDTRAIGKPLEKEQLDKGWCGAGSMPCLTPNGKVYPCFRFTPNTMEIKENDFYVGDVVNGFNHKERFNLVRDCTRGKISDPKCLSCPVESVCAWCIGGVYSCTGRFGRGVNLCKINQITDKFARKYWNEYNELMGIPERYEEQDYSGCLE